MNEITIQENEGIDQVSFDIVSEDANGEKSILARCWDFFLAEKIKDTVESYMKENLAISADNG